jgi:hypothetical protein
MNAEERREWIQDFLDKVDWETYDYTKAPGADMKFPDFTNEQVENNPPWVPKHYNKTQGMSCVHVPDLNQIADGAERKMMAYYGIPVEWPSRKDDPDALKELIAGLDAARADGGKEWKQAADEHGIVNDDHYEWLRGRMLGIPEGFTDYEKAKAAIVTLDAALNKHDRVEERLAEFGFVDKKHYLYFKKWVQRAKEKAWADTNAVLQQTFKMLDERFEKNKEALKDELAPFKGVSMEMWAAANARLAQGQALDQVLKQLKIDRALWDEVNAEWNARMSRDTTATIATVYGQAFTGAGQGQFGDTGQAVSASMQAGFGKDVKGKDPMPFEDWVKIQCHMTAATAQGIDANALLAQYKLKAADWGTIGGYWAQKMNSNPMEYLEKYQVLMAKYTQEFATAKAGADVEF